MSGYLPSDRMPTNTELAAAVTRLVEILESTEYKHLCRGSTIDDLIEFADKIDPQEDDLGYECAECGASDHPSSECPHKPDPERP